MEDTKEQSYEELLSKVTDERKRLFLEEYPKFNISVQTAEAIGISERTFYNWLNRDSSFKSAFTSLKKDITHKLIERHEQNIDNVAFDPKTKDQSRIFGSLVRLRAEAPDKYREKPLETKLTGDIMIKLAIPRPWGEKPQIEEVKPKRIENAPKQGSDEGAEAQG